MVTDDDPHVDAGRLRRIEEAFRAGDLDALRAALDDPSVVPNGPLPRPFGTCLVYAIYRSPIAFIRTLLELGADPRAPADDGFPPLIAALSCARSPPGAPARPDVDEIIRLLLAFGADPHQRGINDYTALHMAVAEGNALAVHRLLAAGADAELRTRIDDCDTPREMAAAAGLADIEAALARGGRPLRQRLRSGLVLLDDVRGDGGPVRRQHVYRIRLRLWLHKGDPVRWAAPWGPVDAARLEDDGTSLVTDVRIDRSQLVGGLLYGVAGMRVGGTRWLEIAPHLAYGDRGVPGIIPPGALLTVELTVLEPRPLGTRPASS